MRKRIGLIALLSCLFSVPSYADVQLGTNPQQEIFGASDTGAFLDFYDFTVVGTGTQTLTLSI